MTSIDTPAPASTSTETLPESLRALIEEIEATPDLGPSKARGLLSTSNIATEDLMPWADFAHSASDSYGRHLVWQGPYYELMVMSWVDGDMAAIHDHGFTQWGAVKFFGRAEHAIFQLRDGILSTAERREFEAGDVVSVNHDLVHQMGNVGQENFLSLHFYGCYGRSADITAEARLYELDEKAIQITSGGVFFTLPNSEIQRRDPAPEGDFPTTLRHKLELLSRLLQMNDSIRKGQVQTRREERLIDELFSPGGWARRELEGRKQSSRGSHESSRYDEILRQELIASDRLRRRLSAAGMLSDI